MSFEVFHTFHTNEVSFSFCSSNSIEMNDSEEPTSSKRRKFTAFNERWYQQPEYSKWIEKKMNFRQNASGA